MLILDLQMKSSVKGTCFAHAKAIVIKTDKELKAVVFIALNIMETILLCFIKMMNTFEVLNCRDHAFLVGDFRNRNN